LLNEALQEARELAGTRGWELPGDLAVGEAERLLALTLPLGPPPEVRAEADGAVALEWDAAARGWLCLWVRGTGTVEHGAVIDGDEFSKTEDFAQALPDWAGELLRRLFGSLH